MPDPSNFSDMPSIIHAMHVLICTDSFGGTLSAAEATSTIARIVNHEFGASTTEIPLSDGGPGFLSSLQRVLNGEVHVMTASSAEGFSIPVTWFESEGIAYIESATVCGIHLTKDNNPSFASTFGVGEVIKAIVHRGIKHVRIGLGGSATNDAGAGMLAALGATSEPAVLADGGLALNALESLNLEAALHFVKDVTIEILTDVDIPLLGARGASKTYASQKGANEVEVELLEKSLEHFSSLCGKLHDGKNPAVALGAGAAGGLAYGLMLLGGKRESGFRFVSRIQNLEDAIKNADLVITGEGTFDWKTLDGKVVRGVAELALGYAKPVVVVAGQVELGRRDFQTIGVSATFEMVDDASLEECMASPQLVLAKTIRRLGKTWLRA